MLPFSQKDLYQYIESLHTFLIQHNMLSFCQNGIDHIAYKARSESHYDEIIKTILPICISARYVRMDERRIAMVELASPASVGSFGMCRYLEIMQPRPAKEGKDYVGLEHAEIYTANEKEIKSLAEGEGLLYEEYENESHKAIVFKINSSNQEIKFTNKDVQAVIDSQEESRMNIWLKR